MAPRFLVGLDLGQAADPTAIVVIEQTEKRARGLLGRELGWIAHYDVIHLQRLALGTAYTDIPGVLRELWRVLEQRWCEARWKETSMTAYMWDADIDLIADATGVGRPVMDLLRDAGVFPIQITISGGRDVHQTGPDAFVVPKRDLVSSVNAVLQGRRLRASSTLTEWPVLQAELRNFKAKISLTGHDSYAAGTSEEWRQGANDDLVLALALAIWHGERLPSAHVLPIHLDPAFADMPRV